MLVACNPSKRTEIVHRPLSAVEENKQNPKLCVLKKIYGEQAALQAVRIQVITTFERCGINLPKDESHTLGIIDWVTEQIVATYSNMKVKELMLFLDDVEKGAYGDFYGRFNSQQFFIALNIFYTTKRIFLIERLERLKKEAAEKESESKRMTYEQYLKLKV